MILLRLVLAGFGRRTIELIFAGLVLAALAGLVASAVAVVQGARRSLDELSRKERPDLIHIMGRFNRALFELPRQGNLPPATLPVYEPRVEPEDLKTAAGDLRIVPRQSLLRNLVTETGASNVYVFGIDPKAESQVSYFHVMAGRFLNRDDQGVAVIDQATARALGVSVGGSFPVRTAADTDTVLTVVGILDGLNIRLPPLATVPAPALDPGVPVVTSGAFVPLRTSEDIFARSSLTDALVVAKSADDVPKAVEHIREQFRLNTGIFVEESYTRYAREVRDFRLTLELFQLVGIAAAVLASGVIAALFRDVYNDRRNQYAMIAVLGFHPSLLFVLMIFPAFIVAAMAIIVGTLSAVIFSPAHFQMPSLLADFGPITPHFDGTVVWTVMIVGLAAVLAGAGSTISMLAPGGLARAVRRS